MKKILLIITILLSFQFSYSQNNDVYLKSFLMNFGVINQFKSRDDETRITWAEQEESEVEIKLTNNQAFIYSAAYQEYTILNLHSEDSNFKTFLAQDTNDGRCYLTIRHVNNEQKNIMLIIEYNDYIWYYVCNKGTKGRTY